MNTVGRRYSVLRRICGLSLRAVSNRSKVHVAQICEWERGELALRPDQVASIEKLLLRSLRVRAKNPETLIFVQNKIAEALSYWTVAQGQVNAEDTALAAK